MRPFLKRKSIIIFYLIGHITKPILRLAINGLFRVFHKLFHGSCSNSSLYIIMLSNYLFCSRYVEYFVLC